VAAAVLGRSVHHRSEDFLLRHRSGHSSYKPLIEWIGQNSLAIKLNFNNYAFLFTDALYIHAFLNSIKVAFISTLLCLLVGYPWPTASPARGQVAQLLLLLVVLRSGRRCCWGIRMDRTAEGQGVINNVLIWLGVIHEPLTMLYTRCHVVGIVYSTCVLHPADVRQSRKDGLGTARGGRRLGCRPWQAFHKITLPLSRNGILAGSMLVFIPAVGEFVIPALLGGPNALMIGRVLWDEFFSNRAWPVASAVAILLLILLVPFMMWYQSVQARESEERDELSPLVLHFDLPRFRLRLFIHPDLVHGGVFLQRLEAGDGVGRGKLSHAEVVLLASAQRGDPGCRLDFAQGRCHQCIGCGDPGDACGLRARAVHAVQGRFTLNAMTTAPLVMPR